MQCASTMGEDGRTDLSKSKEISSYRMANYRDRQSLYEEYTARMLSDPNADMFQGGTEASIPGKQATADKLYCTAAVQKNSTNSYNKRKSERGKPRCRKTANRNTFRKKTAVKEVTEIEATSSAPCNTAAQQTHC